MSSVQTSLKQSKGYFVTTAACYAFTLSGASGAGGSFVPGTMSPLAAQVASGTVLRDMGKTVVGPVVVQAAGSTNVASPTTTTRVFRKVQQLNRVPVGNTNANGISGGDNTTVPPYFTCYIELPSPGVNCTTASGAASLPVNPVSYVPGMPVF